MLPEGLPYLSTTQNDVGSHLAKTAHKHNCQFTWQAQYWVKFREVWNVVVRGRRDILQSCKGDAEIRLPKRLLQDYLVRFSYNGP